MEIRAIVGGVGQRERAFRRQQNERHKEETRIGTSGVHPRAGPPVMPRPRWSKALLRSVYARASGHCHHCGVALPWDTPRTWHVDHHPVRYADIEDQVCVGVTDPRDESNLVASCAACNTSHAHERDVWFGHSQFPCKRRWFVRLGWGVLWAATVGLGFLVGQRAS